MGAVGLEKFASLSDLEQSHYELQHLVDVSEEIVGTENRVTRELRQLHQLSTSSPYWWRECNKLLTLLCAAVYPGVEDSFIQHGFFDLEEVWPPHLSARGLR